MNPATEGPVMVYLGGSTRSFRCENEAREGVRMVKCGCNVFHHPKDDPEAFVCNACGALYRGD